MWDAFTPVEETLRALDDVVRAGKVLHIGFSDFPAWLVSRADAIAEIARTTRPAGIQVEYNLAQREAERELLPMAETLGMSVLAWSPLGAGVLSGKQLQPRREEKYEGRVVSGAVPRAFDKYKSEPSTAVTRQVLDVAAASGHSPAQIAIAWLRRRSRLNIPIIGARSVRHLKDNLGAVDVALSDTAFEHLDEVSQPSLGFPHDFIRSGWRDWFGSTPERLDPRIRGAGANALGLDVDPTGG